MSDDLDFDMEVVEQDELGADGSDSGERSRSERDEDGEAVESDVDGSDRTEPENKSENRKSSSERWNALGTPPEDWETRKVGSLTEMRNGEATDHIDEGEAGYTVYGSNGPIGSYREPNFNGGLVVGRVGAVGEVEWVPEAAWVSDNAIQLSVKEAVNDLYLYYALDDYEMAALATTTAQPLLNQSTVSRVSIPTPPLPEQRKIASVLYAVDQAIQKTEAIIEQTERTKIGVAQDLFHSGVGDRDTKETWLGVIPASWKIVQFSEVVESSRNGLYKSEDSYGEGHPIAKMGNALDNRILDMRQYDRLELNESERRKYRLKPGDLIFARRAQEVSGAGHCTLVPELDEVTVFESSLIRVRLSDTVLPSFYAQYFEGPVGSRAMQRIVTETSISGISTSDLLNLEVPVPSLDEQEEIASTLSSFDQQVRELRGELDQLSHLKKGLMQDLLTGEVRTTGKAIEVLGEVAAHG